MHKLKELLSMRKTNKTLFVHSACTADELCITAALEHARDNRKTAVIEATANQCNQFGGYTGMTPKDFADYVKRIANKVGFNTENLILGGDHLGPLTFKDKPEAEAMALSKDLLKAYIEAGFTKIHLDTSMKLAGDNELTDTIIAKRGAELYKVCEENKKTDTVYIIGSEVPVPGGAVLEDVAITTPEKFESTISAYKSAFSEKNLTFDNVIGVVVQPGVEFGDDAFHEYDRKKFNIKEENFVFEAHSTDYQQKEKLLEMLNDGFAILKVGPELTFKRREALFALNYIENEMNFNDKSNFVNVLVQVLLADNSNYKNHYFGTNEQITEKIKYSYFDRSRYYLYNKNIINSTQKLICNLKQNPIPMPLLSQFLPNQYQKIKQNELKNDPIEIIKNKIKETIL